MKGNVRILEQLNKLLSLELGAINQYVVHAGMSENWGYDQLAGVVMKRAKQEMEHAKELIDRILFLEGTPTVTVLGPISIGKDVPSQVTADHTSELTAINAYNSAIALAGELGDASTREMLEHIAKEEDQHINYIEAQQEQMKQMGNENFLTTIVG